MEKEDPRPLCKHRSNEVNIEVIDITAPFLADAEQVAD
jgi:hypothetical protein